MGAGESTPLAVEERSSCFRRGPDVTAELYDKHNQGEDIPGLLTQVPDCLTTRVSLYCGLDLSFNLLTEIPTSLPLTLPHLVLLNLSHNRLTSLPDSIFGFLHLRELDVSYNQLSSLPSGLCLLDKLRKFDVSHNVLSRLPSGLEQLVNLEKLNLSRNQLQYLPLTLGGLPRLSVILADDQSPPLPAHPQPLLQHLQCCHATATASQAAAGANVNVFPRIRGTVFDSRVLNSGSAESLFTQMQAQAVQTGNRLLTPMIPPLGSSSLDAERLKDAVLGMLYGAVLGDTLGLLTICMSPIEAQFHYNRTNLHISRCVTDTHRVNFSPGRPSPVSHLLLLSLDCILAWAGVVDELEYGKRLEQWWDRWQHCLDSPVLASVMVKNKAPEKEETTVETEDLKEITEKSEVTIAEKPEEEEEENKMEENNLENIESTKDHNIDNTDEINTETKEEDIVDSLCLPPVVGLVVAQFHNLHEVRQDALRICSATHSHTRSKEAAGWLAVTLSRLLQGGTGESLDGLLKKCEGTTMLEFEEGELRAGKEVSDPFTAIIATLEALQEFRRGGFQAALTDVVMQGGCATVNGCVAGAVFGLLDGYTNLPTPWLNELKTELKQSIDKRCNHLLDLMGIP